MLPDFARLHICAFSNQYYYEQQRQVSLFVSTNDVQYVYENYLMMLQPKINFKFISHVMAVKCRGRTHLARV